MCNQMTQFTVNNSTAEYVGFLLREKSKFSISNCNKTFVTELYNMVT